VVNRQTIAVTIGTIVLLVVGVVLMYGTPSTPPPKPDPAASQAKQGAKAKGKGSKSKAVSKRVGPAKLIHSVDVPADRPQAPKDAPNVVMVVLSTQRRDQWTPYAGSAQDPPVTPFLAEKAGQGALMMDALAVAVDPHPSDAAILTGRYPHRVGAIETSDKRNNNPIAESAETIAERLAAAGWNTVGLSANHHMNQKAGGAQGFDWYRDSQPFSLMLDARIAAPQLVNLALQRVAQRPDELKARPLFLQLAFVDSHKPLKVPPAEFEPFKGPEKEMAPYLGSMHRQDQAIKTLVEGLAEHGITAENTVFVVIADHGEGLDMPPHHRSQHGFVLYDSIVRIPWLWWGKGIGAGVKVEGVASQIDLAPTLVSLAGLKDQTGFDGVDLSAAVKAGGKSPRTSAYADTLYEGVHRASIWTAERQCQKDYGTTKQIDNDQFENACYDRVADPTFTQSIEDAALAAELEKLHNELMGAVDG
jgi:arylsulfatase A-like enzyme